jgi:hypothetical protein
MWVEVKFLGFGQSAVNVTSGESLISNATELATETE